ncbi:2-amino-4-hydroxy-6-hydroxymethyldihydropteridine diphosphokinase [Tsuneonella sp. HG094]
MSQRYLIALGSNVPHAHWGRPTLVVGAALEKLGEAGITVERASRTFTTNPVGPSNRRYANAAAVIATGLTPPDLLDVLKDIEAVFGRRQSGQRWRGRVLDLDIVLWTGGCWSDPSLTIPHPAFRTRAFVLAPASEVAPKWRDPITGLTIRQLATRLTRPQPLA